MTREEFVKKQVKCLMMMIETDAPRQSYKDFINYLCDELDKKPVVTGEDVKITVSKEWVEEVVSNISLHCRRDRCGDIEFDGEEAEDDLQEGLKKIGVKVLQ